MDETKKVKDITLHIFGKDFFIQTDEDEEYTQSIAKFLSDEMKSIAKQAGTEKYEKIAVIAALNIVDKYFRLQNKLSETEDQFNRLLDRVGSK